MTNIRLGSRKAVLVHNEYIVRCGKTLIQILGYNCAAALVFGRALLVELRIDRYFVSCRLRMSQKNITLFML